MSLEKQISDIQNKLKNNEYPNEQSISQGIVLRLLSLMEWPIYDTQTVIPEYNINGRRVDFALCIPKNKPKIFIEVKQPGKIRGADQQLFEYAYHKGVPFAIVTDGKEWHFYLPMEVGSYDERRVYKLNLIERDQNESAYYLERYLSFNEVVNGKAYEKAREDYKNVSKVRQAKANIPIAWEKLLEKEDEILIDVLSEKVDSICGHRPTQQHILSYLFSLKPSVFSPQLATSKTKDDKNPSLKPLDALSKKSKKTILKVSFPDGVEICEPKVADTMVEVIKKIGIENVKSLNIQMCGFPIVSNQKHRQETYNWSEAGSGIYIFTHSNTDKKISQLNEINDGLSLGLKVEKI